MARIMSEKQTEVYRTVVRATYLEDGPVATYWNYETRDYEDRPAWRAGETKVETFGPYDIKSVNRDYSQNDGWRHMHNEETKKHDYVKVADVVVEKQVLKPVLALNEHGALELALDWVRYN